MTLKLFLEAIIKFISGIILTGVLIFVPAGTFDYPNGWLFMAVLFIPMLFGGIFMMIKDPHLLKSRLSANEKQDEQKVVILLSIIMFALGFVVAGLNFRFGAYMLPKSVSISSAFDMVLFYLLFGKALSDNRFASRVVEVTKEQKVIDTGLYSIVRHPMYTATLFLFLSMPLVLGSVYSFLIFLIYPFIIVKRIKNEEKLLENELPGYIEYIKKVKYRLIPFIW